MKILTILLLLVIFLPGCSQSSNHSANFDAIDRALKAEGLPSPSHLEITNGIVLATFEMPQEINLQSLESFAREAVVVIKETSQLEECRVTLVSSSGLKSPYGQAWIIRDGPVVWKSFI